MRTLVWYRGKDLRVADHEPLASALAAGGDVVPLFVLDPFFFDGAKARRIAHRMQLLLEGLGELEASLARRGTRLVLASGPSALVVPDLARRWRVDRVVAYRWTEPFGRERDRRVREALEVPFELFEGETLAPAGSIRNKQGRPFSVFTPFARAFRAITAVAAPLPAPRSLPPLPADVAAGADRAVALPTLAALGITRNERLPAGGETAARRRLETFVAGPGARYDEGRDRLDLAGTSRLSVDLKFGTLSVRAVWHETARRLAGAPRALASFHDELVWREFAHATLWDRPDVLSRPFRTDFDGFPWVRDRGSFDAWARGETGYPIVDAAARQLLAEGFVHNRGRMIAASFLTKHLLVDYRQGEAHYLERLADGDWAQNNAGWQWSSGSGCDAQPWFRIFNPVTQGKRFDPDGDYVRRWVPELSRVPTRWIHSPWEAPPLELAAAGVVLGKSYPEPIVEHATARARFLDVAKAHLRTAH